MDTRICVKCHLEKPLSEFYKDKSAKGGSRPDCIACHKKRLAESNAGENQREYQRAYREKHSNDEQRREKARQASREWRRQNSDRKAEYNKQYALKNAKRKRAKDAEWARRNTDRLRASRRVSWQNRRARILSAKGRHTTAEIRSLFRHQKARCYYCNCKLKSPFDKNTEGEKPNLDHVIPLKKGGRNDIGNLVWACAFCNSSKGDKLLTEWRGNGGKLI